MGMRIGSTSPASYELHGEFAPGRKLGGEVLVGRKKGETNTK